MQTPRQKTQTSRGFTIVELLIVIVVIAILASIGIVAYSGIQGRAHDSAVQQDLRQIGMTLELFRADQGRFPEAMNWLHDNFDDYRITVSHGSYADTYFNLLYCTASSHSRYTVVAQSRSGAVYYTGHEGQVRLSDGTSAFAQGNGATICRQVSGDNNMGVRGQTGYLNGTWRAWTGA